MANRQKNPDEKIRYLVKEPRTEFVIEIPASWRVTFGYVNPNFKNGMAGQHGNTHCLRIWEGEKLRAVFADVIGVRDLSIPLARKVQKETGSAEWTQDSAGNFERTEKRAVDEGWNPVAIEDVGF